MVIAYGRYAKIANFSYLYSRMRLMTLIMAAALLCSCIGEKNGPSPGDGSIIKTGDAVPHFDLPGIATGEGIVSPDDFMGEKTLLVFFITDCKDCRREMPFVDYAYRRLSANGLKVKAIGRSETTERVAAFWADLGLDPAMPHYLDPAREVYALFAEHTVPRIYLVDETGTVVWMAVEDLGYGDFDAAKGDEFNTLITNKLNL